MNPRAAVLIQLIARDTRASGRTTVWLDRYDGRVLEINGPRQPPAVRAHALNEAIHQGTVLGWPSRVVTGFSSLLVVVCAATGCVVWVGRSSMWLRAGAFRLLRSRWKSWTSP